jgi:hypothetical protein
VARLFRRSLGESTDTFVRKLVDGHGGAHTETLETKRQRFKLNALSAVASLRTMPRLTENIAAMPAIFVIVSITLSKVKGILSSKNSGQ